MNVDTSKITDLAQREEAVKLYEAKQASKCAASAAEDKSEAEVSDEELGHLRRVAKAAEAAYIAHPLDVEYDLYGGGGVMRCALSNVPLRRGDDVLEDEHGRKVLSILVLPPFADAAVAGDELPATAAA